MKNRPNPFLRSALLAASFVLTLGTAASAGTLYWDGNGTGGTGNPPTAGVGTSGTWTSAGSQWWNGTAYQAWNAGGGQDIADFRGTYGTVTVSGTVTANKLNIVTGTNSSSAFYTFTGGTIDMGSSGVIDTNTTNSTLITSSLAGSITLNSTGTTSSSFSNPGVLFLNGSNSSLGTLNLNVSTDGTMVVAYGNTNVLGGASSTTKLTKGTLSLGNTSNVDTTLNVGTLELAGGTLRARFGVTTFNAATSLTANSWLSVRNSAGVGLIFSSTSSLNLNSNTLFVNPSASSSGIAMNGIISGTGNITTAQSSITSADNALGTLTFGAANTFSGTATTSQNLGSFALKDVNALQNATLNTGLSGTQAVTFAVVGTNTYNIGAMAGSDALAIGGNTISVGTKAVDTIFAADISGASGGLTKVGSNKLTLTAGTSYTGATSITGGTLALTGSGAVNSSSGITINDSGSGAKLLHTGSTAISTAVTLTNGTLTGSGTVNTVNVGAGTGGIISNNDGVSGTALTIGTLTLAGGANINLFSNSTAADLIVTTLTNNSAANAVTITANNAGGWTNGSTYNLIGYTTLNGTGLNNFAHVVNNLSARQTPTWGDTGSAIQITVNGDIPRWVGDGDGKWNLASTNNWKLVTGGGYTTFLATDDVLFDNNATGTTSINIDAANVAPNTIIFNNTTAKSYAVDSTGGFGISAGSLTKNSNGSVTISTNNTYSGPTTLNDGTVTLSGSGTLGSGSALAMNGGQLDLGNASRTVGAVSITAPAASGDTLLNGSLTGTSYAVSNSSGDVGISANLLVNGAAGFTKSGAGTTTLSGANTWTGTTAINAGSLVLSGAGTLGNGAALTLGGGSLDLGTLSRTVGAVSVTAPAASGDTISNGSLTGTSYAASNTSGNAIISANLLVNGAAGFTLSGAGGTATLSGANTYTGTTAINAGTLKAGNASAFNNTSALSMSGSGTFDLAGYNASFTNILAAAGTNTITTTGAGSGTDTLTVSAFGVDGTGALFTDNGTRKLQVSLTSGGLGSWQATTNANNTYSGGLVLGGSMRVSVLAGTVGSPGAITNGAFGKGSITVNDSSQIWFAVSGRTLVNDVVVNGNAGNGNRNGTFRIGTNSAALTGLVVSGNINANLADAHFGSDSTADGTALLLSGKLTGNSGFRFFLSANAFKWTATLNNATGSPNDYVGNTTINSAQTTLALGAADQIPNGDGFGDVILSSGTLDLAGFNETINDLSGAGTVDNVATGTTNTLTLGDNDAIGASIFSGVIKNTTGSLSLIKIGTGTQTLSGANTFTGGLTIKNGTVIAGTVNTALGGSTAGVANGLGTVNLGDTTGTNAATLLVSTSGLNFANPIVLATNATSGILALGNTGTAISTTFSGGVTGSNDLTIISNATTGTVSLTTAAIDNVGKITNTGAGSGTTTISSSIGANVTEVIETSATSTLLLSGSNTAFAGNYSVNSGRMAIGAGFAINAGSEFNLGATTAGTNNTTLSLVNNFSIANDINIRSGNSGTKTISLGTAADLTSTLSGTVTLDDNLILDASGSTAAASLTLSGNIVDGVSGAKGLTKNSAGFVILSGTASDFSGSVTINAGELRIAHAAALGDSTNITVGGINNSAMTLTGGITAGSSKNINIKGGGVGGFFGALATATTNTGTSEWQGSVTIDATTGTRIGSQAGTLKISGNIGETTAGSQLVIRNTGSGITILSGTNNYTGETTINASGGELQVSGGSAIYDSGVVNVVNSAGNVFRVSGSETIGSLTGGGNTTAKVAIESSQVLTLSSGTQTFAGVIEGAGALTVNGAVQTLTGINTYSGDTTITTGTLALTGTGSIATSANLKVNSTLDVSALTADTFTIGAAQTLSGNGTITATGKTLSIEGTHAVGNSPGQQDITGNVSYTSTSIFEWDLAANADTDGYDDDSIPETPNTNVGIRGTDFDALDITGTLAIDSSATFKVIQNAGVSFSNPFWTQNQEWSNIFTYTGSPPTGWSNTAVSVYNTSNVLQDVSVYGAFTITGSTLSWSAIPEPTSALVGLLIGAGLLRRRRQS